MKAALLALAVSLPFAGNACAQTVADVHFLRGDFGAMVSGTITGDEYFDYRLGASGGQELFAELMMSDTNGNGTVYFNILPPGSDGVAIFNGSMDGNVARVTLPEDGDYTIRVYLMGNDRDAGKTVGYNLDLSIQ
ncbi:hypothetical protein [Aliiruegeria lutimaris]|uniref:Inhibitor of g-type lysozyme n=1 Tax=Aliiruegeria lutimaris TaxID=571298 RepID=A0A1G8TL06_9RHOB|nr:hypothetical protein [Aliiruegeria lutimaris]SDJ42074.1 hypothetical protein SAMN04488026_101733 [Aliiruegeria lutimaris]